MKFRVIGAMLVLGVSACSESKPAEPVAVEAPIVFEGTPTMSDPAATPQILDVTPGTPQPFGAPTPAPTNPAPPPIATAKEPTQDKTEEDEKEAKH